MVINLNRYSYYVFKLVNWIIHLIRDSNITCRARVLLNIFIIKTNVIWVLTNFCNDGCTLRPLPPLHLWVPHKPDPLLHYLWYGATRRACWTPPWWCVWGSPSLCRLRPPPSSPVSAPPGASPSPSRPLHTPVFVTPTATLSIPPGPLTLQYRTVRLKLNYYAFKSIVQSTNTEIRLTICQQNE